MSLRLFKVTYNPSPCHWLKSLCHDVTKDGKSDIALNITGLPLPSSTVKTPLLLSKNKIPTPISIQTSTNAYKEVTTLQIKITTSALGAYNFRYIIQQVGSSFEGYPN